MLLPNLLNNPSYLSPHFASPFLTWTLDPRVASSLVLHIIYSTIYTFCSYNSTKSHGLDFHLCISGFYSYVCSLFFFSEHTHDKLPSWQTIPGQTFACLLKHEGKNKETSFHMSLGPLYVLLGEVSLDGNTEGKMRLKQVQLITGKGGSWTHVWLTVVLLLCPQYYANAA